MCQLLACRNYNGPQRASPEHKGSSQRNYSRGPYSPGFEFEDDSHSRYMSDHSRSKIMYERDMEDSEVQLSLLCVCVCVSMHMCALFVGNIFYFSCYINCWKYN